MHEYLPLSFRLKGRCCLVVGAGAIGTHKAEALLRYGATVVVVAPEATEALQALALGGEVVWHERDYRSQDVAQAHLTIAATGDPQVNRQVYEDAEALMRPVNVVDVPELCSVIFPSILWRGDVSVAVSTSGRSPTLARVLRERLECVVGEEYGRLAELLWEQRPEAGARAWSVAESRRRWEQAVNSGALEHLKGGRVAEAREAVRRCLLY
ncbi:MAG TPA: bifunctional precorrin-2 dehydrogenase/sirohydrochlorin ferrochelatase [Armatimonadota bacterium]|jgi:uroporphyrin-III C-methyltransferase/precorrin-2 dehydrogenase/sirohydrochlorin ferrochelatase